MRFWEVASWSAKQTATQRLTDLHDTALKPLLFGGAGGDTTAQVNPFQASASGWNVPPSEPPADTNPTARQKVGPEHETPLRMLNGEPRLGVDAIDHCTP